MPAESVAEAIGDCAKAAIEALNLTAGSPAAAVSVVTRKNPGKPEGATGTATQISVSVLEDSGQALDARRRLKTYKLVLVIVAPGGAKAAPDATVQKWRKLIEQAIDDRDRTTFATLITGAELNRADYTGGALPFDPAAAPKDANYSALNFELEVIESRA